MPQLLYPNIDKPSSADLLVLFATLKDYLLDKVFLLKEGNFLVPLTSYEGEGDPPMDRRSRLLMEASSIGLVVLDEDWMFLGWHQSREVWLGVSRASLRGNPQQVVSISPEQFQQLVKDGITHHSYSPDYPIQVQPWLIELARQIGWLDQQGPAA